jgi:protein-S-isoprenylcysteine O-methyltransferase Ste14
MELSMVDEELLFRILFVTLYLVFAGVRFYYRGKTIGRESEKDYGSVDSMGKSGLGLSLAILLYLGGLFVYAIIPDWIFWAHIDLTIVVRFLGAGIAILSIGLVFWIHRTLGKQYSAKHEIQKDHQLITAGPYSLVRHPMYTTLNLFSISMALVSSNLLLIIFAVLVALPFPWIAMREEAMLTDQFGDEYRAYMKRTGRFFPPIRHRKQENSLV